MQLPAVTAIFRFSQNKSGGSTNTKKTEKKGGRKKPVVSTKQAVYNFFALSNVRESLGPGVLIHTVVI